MEQQETMDKSVLFGLIYFNAKFIQIIIELLHFSACFPNLLILFFNPRLQIIQSVLRTILQFLPLLLQPEDLDVGLLDLSLQLAILHL